MTQPFCCDITSGTKEEQNEFKRLYVKASKEQWQFDNYYFGYDKYGSWDNWKKSDTAIELFTRIISLPKGISILKKMVGEETPKEDISIYVKSIRSNFEMWQKGEIKDGAFSWHLQNNLLHIEKIIQPTE